jgi:hypothetical protein
MGTPIIPPVDPDPVDAGVDCVNCWGSGKSFGVDSTPESLVLTVSGMNKGPGWSSYYGDPPDGEYTIEQEAGLPCDYEGVDGDFVFKVFYLNTTSQAQIIYKSISLIFATTSNPVCALYMENVLTYIFVGGSMSISVPEVK